MSVVAAEMEEAQMGTHIPRCCTAQLPRSDVREPRYNIWEDVTTDVAVFASAPCSLCLTPCIGGPCDRHAEISPAQ